jgi:hypothetical protein
VSPRATASLSHYRPNRLQRYEKVSKKPKKKSIFFVFSSESILTEGKVLILNEK